MLICKIIEKKGDNYLVELENQLIILDKKHFSENVKIGQKIKIFFHDESGEKIDKKIAQEILNEILS